MSATFNIAFEGELCENCSVEQVKVRLGEKFRMPAGKVEQLFCGRRVIMKKGLSEAKARTYVRELAAIGMRVSMVGEGPPAMPHIVATPLPSPEEGYRIVYSGGILAGFGRDAVIAAARSRLKLNEAQAAAVFSGRERGLKRGLDRAGAQRYLQLMSSMGMDVRCDPPLEEPEPAPAEAVAEAPAEAVVVAPVPAPAADPALAEDPQAMTRTMFWSPAGTSSAGLGDGVEDRLLAAINPDFELPGGDGMFSVPAEASATDLGNSTRHLVETMLNADALKMYEREIEEAAVREVPADEIQSVDIPLEPEAAAAEVPFPEPSAASVAASAATIIVPRPKAPEEPLPLPPEEEAANGVPAADRAPLGTEPAPLAAEVEPAGAAPARRFHPAMVVGGGVLLAVAVWLAMNL